jgi:hypothetical protein
MQGVCQTSGILADWISVVVSMTYEKFVGDSDGASTAGIVSVPDCVQSLDALLVAPEGP